MRTPPGPSTNHGSPVPRGLRTGQVLHWSDVRVKAGLAMAHRTRAAWRVLRNTRRLLGNPVLRGALAQFDPRAYSQGNPDVLASSIDPLEHMIRYGLNEKRSLVRPDDEPQVSVASPQHESDFRGNEQLEVLIIASAEQPQPDVLDFATLVIEQFRNLSYSVSLFVEGQGQCEFWQSLVGPNPANPAVTVQAEVLNTRDLDLATWLQSRWNLVSCVIAVDAQAADRARLLGPMFPNTGAILEIRGKEAPPTGKPVTIQVHEWVNDSWAVVALDPRDRFGCLPHRAGGIATRMLALGRGRPNASVHNAISSRLLARTPGPRDVIVLPIIDWNYRRARPQHLSSAIADRGCRVFYLGVRSFLGTTPVLRMQDSPEPFVIQCALQLSCEPLALHIRRATDEQITQMVNAIATFMDQQTIVDPLFVVQHPFWEPVVSRLEGGVIAYDIADRLDELQQYQWDFDGEHSRLIRTADSVLVSADLIRDDVVEESAAGVTVVRNATTEPFLVVPRPTTGSSHRPQVGYVGSLSFWFDASLLFHTALLRPEYDFVIYGAPEEPASRVLRQAANVRLIGEVPHSEIPQRLVNLDVGVIPFRRSRLVDATNPVKAYEYLAAGLPIVSTPMPEMRHFPATDVWVAGTAEAFATSLDEAMTSDHVDAARRRAWASKETWANRVEQIRVLFDVEGSTALLRSQAEESRREYRK